MNAEAQLKTERNVFFFSISFLFRGLCTSPSCLHLIKPVACFVLYSIQKVGEGLQTNFAYFELRNFLLLLLNSAAALKNLINNILQLRKAEFTIKLLDRIYIRT